jgi:methylenetetrahydrofolate dehydrogenase (NADP+)/methenyltetrahydrofolate cyclohydrolase
VRGQPAYLPATPHGVQQLLLRSGHPPDGKRVVVCGRSNLVGKPLAVLLMQKREGANATVTVCHTGTLNLPSITRDADILVAAMGSAGAITTDMVREGAVVIDVGTNAVPDATKKSGSRLVGDVDFVPVAEKASAITPVPGGVGPMTRAMLLWNTVLAAEGGPR